MDKDTKPKNHFFHSKVFFLILIGVFCLALLIAAWIISQKSQPVVVQNNNLQEQVLTDDTPGYFGTEEEREAEIDRLVVVHGDILSRDQISRLLPPTGRKPVQLTSEQISRLLPPVGREPVVLSAEQIERLSP